MNTGKHEYADEEESGDLQHGEPSHWHGVGWGWEVGNESKVSRRLYLLWPFQATVEHTILYHDSAAVVVYEQTCSRLTDAHSRHGDKKSFILAHLAISQPIWPFSPFSPLAHLAIY
ncbi:hypothetical protein BC938DRAFT_483089 [Jimgerdemannia flammicorona]|uniref:Uncharacterized protein n=1 Tax=Jimgerdemannia flammicorona TaxID=994334 RepID=A0A433QCP5_9FUNG|nr:hypothetical protein BC938DRAFT_483089 [Jimgerdemannia flammicorona]